MSAQEVTSNSHAKINTATFSRGQWCSRLKHSRAFGIVAVRGMKCVAAPRVFRRPLRHLGVDGRGKGPSINVAVALETRLGDGPSARLCHVFGTGSTETQNSLS